MMIETDKIELAQAVMQWWKEHECDTVCGDRNLYDKEPEMVRLAREAISIETAKKQSGLMLAVLKRVHVSGYNTPDDHRRVAEAIAAATGETP